MRARAVKEIEADETLRELLHAAGNPHALAPRTGSWRVS